MSLSSLFVLGVALALAAGALLAKLGGPRGGDRAIALSGPVVCLCMAGFLAAPWLPAIEGRVTANEPGSKGCTLQIEGASGEWRERVTLSICAQCPVGVTATKPARSLDLRCRGVAVDTSPTQLIAYIVACVGAAVALGIYGARRWRG